MKPKFLAFPLNLVLTSSAVMAVLAPLNSFAADFTWKGTTNSTWGTGTNWLGGSAPAYGATLTADRLVIGNGANAGAVYDPGAGVTTTFGSGRGIIIGSTTQGAANLTVSSGTLKINGAGTAGNEPIMANGVSASLLIDGGNFDITGHPTAFRFFGSAATSLTSNLTISSGSFSSNGFDLLTVGTAGTGTINLNGGSMAVTGFTRTATTATSILNLNGGTLRIRGGNNANFLNALTGLQTIVKTGGAVIDSNNLNLTIAEVLEHDTTLGTGLDGGLTKNGAGTLTLSGASTYNGATKVTAGILSLGVSQAIQNSALDTLNSVTGDAGNGLKTTVTALTFGGLSGDKNLADVFTTTSGGYSGVTALTLNPGTGVSHSYSGMIANGAMTLTKNGLGTQRLSGANSYDGATSITAGSVTLSDSGTLGSNAAGTSVASGSSLGLSGAGTFGTNETLTITGAGVTTANHFVTGSAGSRGALQSISGSNSYAGNIELGTNTTIRIGTQNGASLEITGAITQASGITTGSVYFRPGDTAGDYVTLSNSGNSFGGDSRIYTNATAGNHAGVRLGVDNALPTSLTILGDTGTGAGTALDLNGKIQTLNGLAGSTNLNIINSNTSTASTLTVDNLVDRTTAGTVIRGGVGLGTINVIKDGAFTQALSATNDYTGTTVVNAGKLLMGDAAADNFATSGVTVASNATLGGSGTIAGTVGVTGILAPGITGVSGGIGTLAAGETTWKGAATSDAATIWQFDLSANSNVSDTLAITGAFKKDSTVGTVYEFNFMNSAPTTWGNVYTLMTWTTTTDFTSADQFTWSNLGGAYDLQPGTGFTLTGAGGTTGGSLTFTAVPEPTSALAGLLIAAGLLRRRRSA